MRDKMKLNRKWITIIGYLLAFGVFSNTVIYPFFPVKIIDWTSLISLIGVMLGISGFRDIGLNKGGKDDSNSDKV